MLTFIFISVIFLYPLFMARAAIESYVLVTECIDNMGKVIQDFVIEEQKSVWNSWKGYRVCIK